MRSHSILSCVLCLRPARAQVSLHRAGRTLDVLRRHLDAAGEFPTHCTVQIWGAVHRRPLSMQTMHGGILITVHRQLLPERLLAGWLADGWLACRAKPLLVVWAGLGSGVRQGRAAGWPRKPLHTLNPSLAPLLPMMFQTRTNDNQEKRAYLGTPSNYKGVSLCVVSQTVGTEEARRLRMTKHVL